MSRILLHHAGAWMEWSRALDVPATTGMGHDEMLGHLTSRGIPEQEARRAMDISARSGSSMRDEREPQLRVDLATAVAGNQAGQDGAEMSAAEIVRRYLVERETLY